MHIVGVAEYLLKEKLQDLESPKGRVTSDSLVVVPIVEYMYHYTGASEGLTRSLITWLVTYPQRIKTLLELIVFLSSPLPR
jgi:hypothetical protein